MTTVATSLRVAVTARSVYPLHGVGGLERHLHDLLRHLVRAGARVHVITRPTKSVDPRDVPSLNSDRLQWSFVPYRTFPLAGRRGTTVIDRSTAYLLFGLQAGGRAASLAKAGEVDVVYGHGASVLGYARQRRQGLAACPLIFNPHGLEEFTGTGHGFARHLAYAPLRAAVRQCAHASDRVIATDQSLVPVLTRHLHVADDRMRVVPNAVDLEDCDASAEISAARTLRASLLLPAGARVLLSVGRVEANKGYDVLAHALSALRANPSVVPEWRWVLVGDGPFRQRLEETIRHLGLERQVLLAGRVSTPELHGWYRAADLFVHPTLYEGSSIVTLEAMAHALPVVATRAGGLPDKVVPSVTGWLVTPGKSRALADTLAEALAPGAPLSAYGRAARALVEERFTWAAAVSALIGVFGEVSRPS
jgi:glycosyltransferase involved in cell wall biosynthesis